MHKIWRWNSWSTELYLQKSCYTTPNSVKYLLSSKKVKNNLSFSKKEERTKEDLDLQYTYSTVEERVLQSFPYPPDYSGSRLWRSSFIYDILRLSSLSSLHPRTDQSRYGHMAFRDCPRRTRIHIQVLRLTHVQSTLVYLPDRCVLSRFQAEGKGRPPEAASLSNETNF